MEPQIRSSLRRWMMGGAAVGSLLLALISLLRFVSFDHPLLYLSVPLAPAALAVTLTAAAVLVSGAVRWGVLAAVAAAVVVALPGTGLPRIGCNWRTEADNAVTVFSHNASWESFDADEVAAQVLGAGSDIVVLQEADPAMTRAVQTLIGDDFAHAVSGGGDRTLSLSIISRWPITTLVDTTVPDSPDLLSGRWSDETNPMLFATVDSPHGELRLGNVHFSAPRRSALVERRRVEVPTFIDQLQAWSSDGGDLSPDLIVGDFNASNSHADYRRIADDAGYLDAHRLAGCGLGTTWSPLGLGPGLLALDHVLVREADGNEAGATSTAVTVEAVRSHGYANSDHRAISAVVSLSASGADS